MSKGRDKHQARQQELSLFGKDLVRRCGSQCEVCQDSGVSLSIFEVPPVPTEPEYERCLMICETCKEQIEHPKRIEPNRWRCLGTTMWSEVIPAKVTAVVMLNHLNEKLGVEWAQELLEQVFLVEDEQAWVDQWQIGMKA
jgi:protein PhnA